MRPDLFLTTWNRAGSSMAEATVSPTIGLTPGVDINSWALASWRASASPHPSFKAVELAQQHGVGREQCLGHDFQGWMSGHRSSLIRAAKPPRRGRPHLQPGSLAKCVAQARLDIAKLRLHQLAGGEQRCSASLARSLTCNAPAETNQAVLAARYRAHRCGQTSPASPCLECVTHVPRLQQLDRKAGCPHPRIQPLRKRPGLQADPHQAQNLADLSHVEPAPPARSPPSPPARSSRSRIHNANTFGSIPE